MTISKSLENGLEKSLRRMQRENRDYCGMCFDRAEVEYLLSRLRGEEVSDYELPPQLPSQNKGQVIRKNSENNEQMICRKRKGKECFIYVKNA